MRGIVLVGRGSCVVGIGRGVNCTVGIVGEKCPFLGLARERRYINLEIRYLMLFFYAVLFYYAMCFCCYVMSCYVMSCFVVMLCLSKVPCFLKTFLSY